MSAFERTLNSISMISYRMCILLSLAAITLNVTKLILCLRKAKSHRVRRWEGNRDPDSE